MGFHGNDEDCAFCFQVFSSQQCSLKKKQQKTKKQKQTNTNNNNKSQGHRLVAE